MSKLVKRVIGEGAFDADDYMAGGGPGPGADGGADQFDAGEFMGDEGAGGPEEKREVQIANHIMLAANNGDMKAIIALAQELHDMHSQGAGGADQFDAEDFMGR